MASRPETLGSRWVYMLGYIAWLHAREWSSRNFESVPDQCSKLLFT